MFALLPGFAASAPGAPAPTYPGLTLTGATFETTAPIFGTASLKIGSGAATLTVPSGNTGITVEMWLKVGAAPNAGAVPLVQLTDVNNKSFSFVVGGGGNDIYMRANGNQGGSPGQLSATTAHFAFVWADYSSALANVYFNGARIANTGYDGDGYVLPAAGALALAINMPSDGSFLIDSLRVSSVPVYLGNFTPPSGPLARNSTTMLLCQFEGSGAGS